MPLLGLVATPLTLTAGPVASLNLLLWSAFPLSAASMFWVLRRWTTWLPAAFAGGLLYGFSPYMAGQSMVHLHLLFVPLPPLILLAVAELFVRRTGSPRRWGVLLGLLVAGQFLISSEVLVTTGLVVLVGLAVLAAARPRQVVPSLRFAATGLLWGAAVSTALVAYPLAVFLAGPQHYAASSGAGRALLLRADLLSPVVPTSVERLATAGLAHHGDGLTLFGDSTENGSYLGIPLLLLLAALTVLGRADRWIRFAAVMVVATFVMALGSPLSVNGHSTGIPLPDAVLAHVPLVNVMVPARIALFTVLFAAVVLARGLDRVRRHPPVRAPVVGNGLMLAAVTALALVPLVPRWPNRTVAPPAPRYFSSAAVDRIPPGSVVLTYPLATPLHAQAMVWQSVAGMRFSLIGGYGLVPDGKGGVTLFPPDLPPTAVEDFLVNQVGGVPFHPSPVVPDDAALVAAVRTFLVRYGVGVVLVDPTAPRAGRVVALLDRSLGRSPTSSGGIDAWYRVQRAPGLRPVPPSG